MFSVLKRFKSSLVTLRHPLCGDGVDGSLFYLSNPYTMPSEQERK